MTQFCDCYSVLPWTMVNIKAGIHYTTFKNWTDLKIPGIIYTYQLCNSHRRKNCPLTTEDLTVPDFKVVLITSNSCRNVSLVIGYAWQKKIMCSKISWNDQTCLYPPTGWNHSLKLKNRSLWPSYTTRFSMKSVNSNLQTGTDLRQLASTYANWKSVENRGKNRVV